MDKEKEKQLTKYVESMCEDCELGIKIENCRECLFNVFQEMDKHSPFSGEEKDNGKIGDRNSDTRTK